MGFDTMRTGHARCPNYLLAGLFLMCFLLTCNWWSLSSQNYELLKQMDDMGEQLKICSDEKVVCTTRKRTLETAIREFETRMADAKMNEVKSNNNVKQQNNEIAELKNTLSKSKQDLTDCQTELESLKIVDESKKTLLENMRSDKDGLLAKLTLTEKKVKELEEALKTVKPTSSVKSIKASIPIGVQVTPPSPSQKVLPDPKDLQINDGPVHDGNHESVYRDLDGVIENAANEDLEDDPTMKKF